MAAENINFSCPGQIWDFEQVCILNISSFTQMSKVTVFFIASFRRCLQRDLLIYHTCFDWYDILCIMWSATCCWYENAQLGFQTSTCSCTFLRNLHELNIHDLSCSSLIPGCRWISVLCWIGVFRCWSAGIGRAQLGSAKSSFSLWFWHFLLFTLVVLLKA